MFEDRCAELHNNHCSTQAGVPGNICTRQTKESPVKFVLGNLSQGQAEVMTGRHPARNLIWKAHWDSRCVPCAMPQQPSLIHWREWCPPVEISQAEPRLPWPRQHCCRCHSSSPCPSHFPGKWTEADVTAQKQRKRKTSFWITKRKNKTKTNFLWSLFSKGLGCPES